jgi:hypothetical protein
MRGHGARLWVVLGMFACGGKGPGDTATSPTEGERVCRAYTRALASCLDMYGRAPVGLGVDDTSCGQRALTADELMFYRCATDALDGAVCTVEGLPELRDETFACMTAWSAAAERRVPPG